jgi:hypothetical protein
MLRDSWKAHEAHDDLGAGPVVDGQGCAGGERQLSADDAVTAEQARLRVEEVHGPAPSSRHAVATAVELGHDAPRADAAAEGVAVLAVVGEQVVGRLEGCHEADDRRLLAEVEVAVAADLGLGVGARGALFEATDQQHLLVPGELVFAGGRGGDGRVLAGRLRGGCLVVAGGLRGGCLVVAGGLRGADPVLAGGRGRRGGRGRVV